MIYKYGNLLFMRVLKFGGTSLKNASSFFNVFKIIKKIFQVDQVAIVLSAPDNITDILEIIIRDSIKKNNVENEVESIFQFFTNLLIETGVNSTEFEYRVTLDFIKKKFDRIKELITCINILGFCPNGIYVEIISIGEILSVEVMRLIFLYDKYKVTIIDPVTSLVSSDSEDRILQTVDIVESSKRIQNLNLLKKNIILMPGFIAGNRKEEISILGRNGSDYSAAVLSVCLNASSCEIWTDVDGVYSCDPRIVKEAILIKNLTYEEATKLSQLGAKVLHPKTIDPLKKANIPCLVKNTFNPFSIGTLIDNKKNFSKIPIIKGITGLSGVYILIFSINENAKEKRQIFDDCFIEITRNKNLHIIFIKKDLFRNRIIFFVYEKYAKKLNYLLKKRFVSEIEKKIVKVVKSKKNCSIVSIVGSNLNKKMYFFSSIFNVLYKLKINALDMVQDSSKSCFSIIIESKNRISLIKGLHKNIFQKIKTIEIFLIGLGKIGKTLLCQIEEQKKILIKKRIDLKLCGIANSKHFLMDELGINYNSNTFSILKEKKPINLKKFFSVIKFNELLNPVLVDCTSNQDIANQYESFLSRGFNVVAANKKANTFSIELYRRIRCIAKKNRKHFFYETNVGAGLPVISTLRKMLDSGDILLSFKGILSGSLSFIFGKMEEGMAFSKSVELAQKLGFTEPHPYEDLSGIDVARKLLILAREIGSFIELKDIKVEPLLPNKYSNILDKSEFLKRIVELDEYFFDLVQKSKKLGQVLRFVGIIKKNKECCIKIKSIDKNDPLYTVKNGENALSFYSKYYSPIPLVLRGYGAGNKVTASGVFSDVLRTL